MKGLKGRQLIHLNPEDKDRLEEFARKCGNWRDRANSICSTCFREWWKPNAIAFKPDEKCVTCCEHTLIRGYMLKSNGEASPQALCLNCGHRGDISRHDMRPILDVVLHDNTREDRWNANQECSHCHQPGAELHHWAPRAIFNDADSWPKSWLCPDCHRLWHQTMRKASGYRLPPEERSGPIPAWWGGATA